MVLHLGFISTPISLCNATDPDVGITYNFKCIPKDPNTHLPYVEHYSGGLLVEKKHFESKEEVFSAINDLMKKLSNIPYLLKVTEKGVFKLVNASTLVYKSNLLKRERNEKRKCVIVDPIDSEESDVD